MLKNSLRYGLFLFAGLTVWQLIIKQDVEWGMVFGMSILAGLVNLLWDWSNVPYDWE